jgi:transcriptional regulator with PAS, ATPase and Fis domain
MPLAKMVAENKFRQDLLYRINTVEITLPPLRERTEDIQPLIDYYLNVYCKKYKTAKKRISSGTFKRLQMHNWPGNIRELQHAVERAVILSETNILEPHDFFMENHRDNATDDYSPKNMNLEEVEKMLVRKVVDKHGGNISRAAKELGLTRASLYRRIEKYGI